MYETYLLALVLACGAVIILTREAIASRILRLDPIQARLATSLTDASAQGLTPPAVRRFWESTERMLEKRGIGARQRRARMIHALRMCRDRLSQTEFESVRRMVRCVYVDL